MAMQTTPTWIQFLPLLTAVIGAAAGIFGGLALERWKTRSRAQETERAQRHEVSLRAFDLAHVLVEEFAMIFAYNHDGTDAEADALQAAQLEKFASADAELRRAMPRVTIFAKPDFARELEAILGDITSYWTASTPGKSLVVEFSPVVLSLRQHLRDAGNVLKTDLSA